MSAANTCPDPVLLVTVPDLFSFFIALQGDPQKPLNLGLLLLSIQSRQNVGICPVVEFEPDKGGVFFDPGFFCFAICY